MKEQQGKKKIPRFRRVCMTLENYEKHGITYDDLIARLQRLKSLSYFCCDCEVSSNGVPHMHVYAVFSQQIRVSTLKALLGNFIHIEKALGSHAECIAYVEKSGEKHKDKKATQVENSFFEWGERPLDVAEKKESVWANVYEMAKNGRSTFEILEAHPTLAGNITKIEVLVERFRAEQSKREWRKCEVIILYGPTSTGKTSWVYQNYEIDDIYRVTDYRHPYDGYSHEKVICFDEFEYYAESMNLSLILQLIDVFPLGAALPRRYSNMVPNHDTAIFISNERPSRWYDYEANSRWNAFIRRVDKIYCFDGAGKIVEESPATYRREGGYHG